MANEIETPLDAKIKKNILDDTINIAQTITEETRLYVDESGIKLRDVDPAHVGMVDLDLDIEAFESFEGSETVLGIPLKKISGALKLADSKDIIHLEHDTETNRLIIKFGNITQKIPLLDTEGMTEPNIPNLDLGCEIKTAAKHIQTGIRASNNISDHVSMKVTKQNFQIYTEEDEDSVDMTLGLGELEQLNTEDKVKSMFALDYLSDMVKQIPSKQVITINMGPDYPIEIKFTFASGNGQTTYLLAPRIES